MNPPEPTNAWDMANRLKEPRSESRVRWIRSCVYTPPCKKKRVAGRDRIQCVV